MENEDTTDIMDELAAMLPPNGLRSSIPESTLHRISKMVMKETVEDKKVELMQLGTKIPTKDVDVLCLINTCELYGLINDGINKYNNHNTVQGFINNIVGNTIVPTVVESGNEATYMEQDEINDLNEDLLHLHNRLGDNIIDANNKNNHDNTNLAYTGLKSNNILGAHIVEEEKKRLFYGLADKYDEWNNYHHTPTEENKPGSSHTFTGADSFLKLTRPSTTGSQKQDLLVKYLHL